MQGCHHFSGAAGGFRTLILAEMLLNSDIASEDRGDCLAQLCRCFDRYRICSFSVGMTGVVFARRAFHRTHHARTGLDLQVTIKLEVPVDNHFIAFIQTLPHQVIITGPGSQQHLPAFENALSPGQRQIDHCPLAGDQRSGNRNDQGGFSLRCIGSDISEIFGAHQLHSADVAGPGPVLDNFRMHRGDPFPGQFCIHYPSGAGDPRTHHRPHKHLRLELAVGIGDVQPHFHGAGCGVEHRVDKKDPPFEGFTGIRLGIKFDRLPKADPFQIRFVGIEHHPHLGKIGDGINRRAGIDIHAFGGIAADHHSADRRIDRQMVGGGSPLLDLTDLTIGQSPQTQLLPRRLQGIANQRTAPGAGATQGLQQLLLGGNQLRTVEIHQMIILPHRRAGIIDEHIVDPSRHPGRNIFQAGFVVIDLAGHVDLRLHVTAFHRNGTYPGQFGGVRR